jgi:hypothetical protein
MRLVPGFRIAAPAFLAPPTAGLVLLLAAAAASGHELGTIRTNVRLRHGGSYRVDILVDREHLPPGFADAAPRILRPIRNAGSDAGPAGRILEKVLGGARLAFDGHPARPEAEWVNPEPDARELDLRLTGEIPDGARALTWSNSLRVGTYLLTVATDGEAEPVRVWMEPGETSGPIPLNARVLPPTRLEVAREYLALGFAHIVPRGTDHILFVLGIFLFSKRWKPVLAQVTAFTAAHTITLALAMTGIVSLRPAIVEPLIALSIVYVAVENVLAPSLTRARLALVFGFGLVHGMGFAGVLTGLGLPRSRFATALVAFNGGVELGQLAVIGTAFAIVLPFRHESWYRARVVVPASVAIAVAGLYWAIARAAQIRL